MMPPTILSAWRSGDFHAFQFINEWSEIWSWKTTMNDRGMRGVQLASLSSPTPLFRLSVLRGHVLRLDMDDLEG
jgi:hypothetical protein